MVVAILIASGEPEEVRTHPFYKFGTLEDKKTAREEKKEKEMAERRMKKAAKKLNYKRMKSIDWEDRQEKKLDNWKGVSGIYILRGDGNYEITPHPLQKSEKRMKD